MFACLLRLCEVIFDTAFQKMGNNQKDKASKALKFVRHVLYLVPVILAAVIWY
jgi:hypothetical protein